MPTSCVPFTLLQIPDAVCQHELVPRVDTRTDAGRRVPIRELSVCMVEGSEARTCRHLRDGS